MRFLSRRRIVLLMLLAMPLALGAWAWRVASWRPKIARIASKPILSLAWSSDGAILRCACEDGRYRELSGSTLRVMATHGNNKWWSSAQFSGDGNALIVAVAQGTSVEKWSSSPFQRLWKREYNGASRFSVRPTYVNALALSSRAKHWAIARGFENQGTVGMWSVNGRSNITEDKRPKNFPDGVAQALAFSPDNSLLAYGGSSVGIGVWSRTAHKTLWDTHTVFPIIDNPFLGNGTVEGFQARAVGFSPDGRWLGASFFSGLTIIFDASTGDKRPLMDDMKNDRCLVFSADSRYLFGGGEDGNVEVWNVTSRKSIRIIHTGSAPIQSLSLSPDGTRLAVGTSTGQVQLWRVR